MRVLVYLVFWTIMTAGAAHASSFVVLAPIKDKVTPSIIVIGEPALAAAAPGADAIAPALAETPLSYPYPDEQPTVVAAPAEPAIVTVSMSIIAMGVPAVSYDKVAAISAKPKSSRPAPLPVVIRGGIVGDAFSRAAIPEPVAVGTPEVSSAPPPAGQPADPGQPRAPEPAPPPPAPAAPAPQTRAPE